MKTVSLRGICLALVAAATLAVAGLANATPGGGDAWQTVAPMPADLYGGGSASDGTYAYVAGGYSLIAGGDRNTLYRYDPAANSWATRAPMADAVTMPSAVYYPPTNKLYVFGGQNAGLTVTATTRIYDIATNTWSTGANMPDVRGFMASAYNPGNGKIYLVAGYNTPQVTSAQVTNWEYDPIANNFTVRAPIPHGTGGSAHGIINGHMYVAGGRDATNTVIGLVYDYDIAANSWTARASMPTPTNVPGSGVMEGKLSSSESELRSARSSPMHLARPRTRARRRSPTIRSRTAGHPVRVSTQPAPSRQARR